MPTFRSEIPSDTPAYPMSVESSEEGDFIHIGWDGQFLSFAPEQAAQLCSAIAGAIYTASPPPASKAALIAVIMSTAIAQATTIAVSQEPTS